MLLGDDGPDGWGVKFRLEFMMNTSAHLFPPRPRWEERGYRPDEYSRWLKGDWRPIAELWSSMRVDQARVVPAEIELEDRLFDTSAGPERGTAEARFALGHLLKPGDVARSDWRLRCAQPPYDSLPVPRADIPAGAILSREADAWIYEERVEYVALPLYEGRMIGLNEWTVPSRDAALLATEPSYLMAAADWPNDSAEVLRVVFRDIARNTDTRTFITACIPARPCGNPLPLLDFGSLKVAEKLTLVTWLSCLAFDWSVRQRVSGTHLNWHVVESLAVPSPRRSIGAVTRTAAALNIGGPPQAPAMMGLTANPAQVAVAGSERLRLKSELDAVAAVMLGLDVGAMTWILSDCDWPKGAVAGSSRGFWRVDKDKDPELRHTVLTLVAFHDLQEKIRACGGDRDAGIDAFLGQNDGEGWMLPETLRLADYGLGHDERAEQPRPVASRLGPRFYDWQLAQSAEESWRECHLHARNLLGERGYRELLDEIAAGKRADEPASTAAPSAAATQESLFG